MNAASLCDVLMSNVTALCVEREEEAKGHLLVSDGVDF